MAHCPPDIPWWRVVAKDGRLPVYKMDPLLEQKQIQLLQEEGVELQEGKVDMQRFAIDLDTV